MLKLHITLLFLWIFIALKVPIEKKSSGEILNKKLNAQQGFHPRRVSSLHNAIPPNRYYVIIALSAGTVWGTGTVPSVILPVLRISFHGKRKSQDPKNLPLSSFI